MRKKDIYWILFVNIIWNIFLFTQKPIYTLTPDSITYQIEDLSVLINGHRLPLYRLINWIFYKLCGNDYGCASIAVVIFQTIISIVVAIFLYDGLSIVLKSHKLIVFLTLLYGIIVGAFGYNEHILTESLAVSFMTILIWLIIRAISSNDSKLFIILPVVSLLAVLHRPSFVFLFPLIGFFYIIYFFNHKKQAICGFVSLGIALLCILAVCAIHKNKRDLFCLSDVSYENDMGLMVSTDLYYLDEYPEISAYIQDEIVDSESENKCNYFSLVAERFGTSRAKEYLNACKKEYFLPRMRHLIEYVLYPYSDSFIVKTASKMNLKMQMLFAAIRFSVFPFTYGGLIFITAIYFIDSLIRSIKEKRFYYIEMGLIGCIWCIYILSFITLYEASAQRITVHLIPCVIMLSGMMIERIVQVIIQDVNKNKEKKEDN